MIDGQMRDFDRLDTGCFRAFYAAAESLNFTAAARKAAMTQSGVSQHVARLEAQLGAELFLRIGKRVVLTESGKRLQQFVESYLDLVEGFTEEVRDEQHAIQGKVSYAMPASCLMTPHFGLLLNERQRRFPQLELQVELCSSDDVLKRLLAAEIDFGFVTRRVASPDVSYLPFCPEEYVMVASEKDRLKIEEAADLERLSWVSYPGAEVLFEYWLSHSFPRARNLSWLSLSVVGAINHLEGAISMVEAGLGVGVFPEHCVAKPLEAKRLFRLKGVGKGPCLNMIYVVHRAGGQLPKRVKALIEVFAAMKKPSR